MILCTCICAQGAELLSWASQECLLPWCLRLLLPLGLRTYLWAGLASQQAPGSLSLLPKYWITSMHCHSGFLCGCWRGYLSPHALVEIKWRTQRWDLLGRSFHFYLRTLLNLDTLSAKSVTSCLGILLFSMCGLRLYSFDRSWAKMILVFEIMIVCFFIFHYFI